MSFEIVKAKQADIADYVRFGERAEAEIRARGLGQYVPAAHPEYADAIRDRVRTGSLYVARDQQSRAVAFFVLETRRSEWWPEDPVAAFYLGGIVVDPEARGLGVGRSIVEWSAAEARRAGCQALRIDCHAENPWLRAYYESQGFRLVGEVDQAPGYVGCLYELSLAEYARSPAAGRR